MRELVSAVYWAFVGALMSFGFLGAWTIGIPFLLIGVILAGVGLMKLWISGVWAVTIGVAAPPAYIVAYDFIGVSIRPLFIVPSSPSGAQVAVLAFFGAFAVSGPAVRLFLLVRGRLS